jgi:hypothetical protein
MAGGCAIGGVMDVGIGWGIASLNDRKYSVGDGLRDFGTGCATGALFAFGGELLSMARFAYLTRPADRSREISLLSIRILTQL